MKELKLDLLPANLYAAKKKAEREKEKKNQEQKNIVRLREISSKAGCQDGGIEFHEDI